MYYQPPGPALPASLYASMYLPTLRDFARNHLAALRAGLAVKAMLSDLAAAGVPVGVPPGFADVQPETLAGIAHTYVATGLLDLDDELLRGIDLG